MEQQPGKAHSYTSVLTLSAHESHVLLPDGRGPYPGEDGEEAEGDGRPGSIAALPQRVVLWLGQLPLVCQETEAHKPHEGPERWEKRAGMMLEDGANLFGF